MPGKYLTPADVRQFAKDKLNLKVKIKEYVRGQRAYLKFRIEAPDGVLLDGKREEVLSSEISGLLEGKRKLVTHYLCYWLSNALAQLAPQIHCGAIIEMPTIQAPKITDDKTKERMLR